MPTITSLGIGTNGLNIEQLVSGLMAGERRPITQLQKTTTGLKTQLSAYGKVQSALAAMRDAASKLTSPGSWSASVATSSDPTSVSVTAGSGAAIGNVAVSVSKLAASQTLASRALPASPGVIGTGQITIELGQWNSDQSSFTAKSGTTAVTIDIAAGEDQLSQIRDKINAAGAGVVASIVTDASGSRLAMRSSSTGESNAFRVTVNDDDGNSADDQGLSALAFDPSAGIGSMQQTLAAANAAATLNGLPISSESNTLTEAIDGLSITLLKETTGVSLTVAQDKDAIKKNITDFATAYNAVASLLREQTKYDAANKTAGTLQGDSTVVGLQAQLRLIAGGTSTLGGTLTRLADIGLDPGSDGSLKTNTSKLETALGKLDNLKQLFMGLDSGNAANNGLGQQLRSFADEVLGTDGRLSSRQSGLQTRISSNDKREAQLEARVSLTETRLRARYTQLDTQMGKLNGLSGYVSQQLGLMNNNR
jgi:flagellar hook-associated protein 2